MKSKEELVKQLSNFSGNKIKLEYLKKEYSAGNKAAAELFLDIGYDSNLAKELVIGSLKEGNNILVEKYGKMVINYYHENNFFSLIPDIIKVWKNENLIKYHLDRLLLTTRNSKFSVKNSMYESTITHYQKLRPESIMITKIAKEQLPVALKEKRFSWYAFNCYCTLQEFDNAIDWYLNTNKVYDVYRAYELAQEKSPNRILEISQTIYSLGKTACDYNSVIFLEACDYLDECWSSNLAKNTAMKYLKLKVEDSKDSSPRTFSKLATSLKKMKMDKDLKKLLSNLEQYCKSTSVNGSILFYKQYEYLANLYLDIDNQEKALEWMENSISKRVKSPGHPDNPISSIEKFNKRIKQDLFQKELIILHELNRNFTECVNICKKIGEEERAMAYQLLAS